MIDFLRAVESLVERVDAGELGGRPSPDVWSPIEYAAHVGEALTWYAARVRRVLDEDTPQLDPFDFDAAADKGDYNSRDIDTVVTDVGIACQDRAEIARHAGGTLLSRFGLGSDGSQRSAASLLVRADHEIVHHELDLRLGFGLAPQH